MFAKNLISRKLVVFFNGALVLFISTLATLTVQAQRPLGTDVSGYQPQFLNWTAIKSDGVSFAWVKATEGTGYVNPYFTSQLTGAASAGVYAGAYHFARPSSHPNITGANSADSEAAYFWSVAGSYVKTGGGYLVPMLDWEDPGATNGGGFTITQMSQWVNEWCNDVSNDAAASGVIIRPVVYTGTWYSIPTAGVSGYPGLNSTVTSWPDWIAAYPANANAQTGSPGSTSPWSGWNIWQYGDTNWSGGDADVYNGSFQNFLAMFAIGGTNAPYFVASPTNMTVPLGSNATLYAQASGQSLSFQWYFDGQAIPGATSSNYTIVDVQMTNAGPYTVAASNSYANISAPLVTLSVFPPLANYPGAVLDPSNMVNWWTGNANPSDIYGITNLTPNGYLTYTNGEVGMAFRFDGHTTYLTSSGAEILPPWTVCGWIYHQRGLTPSAALSGDVTYALKVEQWSNTDEVGISHSGVGDYLFSPAYTLPLNTWTHLAYVATGSNVTLYANGAQKGTVTVSGFNLPRGFIGVDTFASHPVDYLLGAVNELQIFTNALSAAQIASIYNAGSAGLVRAPQFTGTLSRFPSGRFRLPFIAQTGKPVTILASTDLVNWATDSTVQNPTGTNTASGSGGASQTFYQATQQY